MIVFLLSSFWDPYNVHVNILDVVSEASLSIVLIHFFLSWVIFTTVLSRWMISTSVSYNLILFPSGVCVYMCVFVSYCIFQVFGSYSYSFFTLCWSSHYVYLFLWFGWAFIIITLNTSFLKVECLFLFHLVLSLIPYLFFFFYFCFTIFLNLILFYFLTLQYCIGFAIYQNESTTVIPYLFTSFETSSSFPLCFLFLCAFLFTRFSSFHFLALDTWLYTGDGL